MNAADEMRDLCLTRSALYAQLEAVTGRIAVLVHAYWPCGHDRTDENTAKVGKAGIRCRICKNARASRWSRTARTLRKARGEQQ